MPIPHSMSSMGLENLASSPIRVDWMCYLNFCRVACFARQTEYYLPSTYIYLSTLLF
jgi:hypothetical protein